MLRWALSLFGTKHERDLKKIKPIIAAINSKEGGLQKLNDAQLQAKTGDFKQQLENGASVDDLLIDAFAVAREASRRVLKMRHYDVQLIGGIVLHRGSIAEMRTGEGKTLVATLPVYLNALEGKGVHVVTVNDYLAKRDCEWMGRLYNWLGLTTGVVVNQQDDYEKRLAYQAEITYGQNNEYGFDYLRDNMKFSSLEYVQRELNFAIVDEVDSILIDEARTPLIISGQSETASHKYREINEFIPRFRKDEHYVVDEKQHAVTLTDEGIEYAQELLEIENLFDTKNLESLHILNQCLRAHSLYHRDVHYMVAPDGKIMIIDEFTGRILPGRRWSDGLHQAVEAKEHVPIQEENRTMATISFQNLFRLYKKLAGMTGTAMTESEEFYKTYKLDVVPIPTNKSIVRRDYQDVVYKTEKEKFQALLSEIEEFHERGNPILIGTISVEKSNAISRLLERKGIPHQVLNAKQHEREAYIVAQAGRKGSITVSTNMAGRGTDIILGGNPEMLAKAEFNEADRGSEIDSEEFHRRVAEIDKECLAEREEVKEIGGLHIIGTERHESRRIDNQLRGRAGRQGDPGSSRFFLSLEDELMRIFGGDRVKALMERMGMPDNEPIEHPWVTKSIENAQRKVEARNFDIRKHMLEYDDVMNQQRKTVYTLRRALLEGLYAPDERDEDGKLTGRKRVIKASPEIVEEIKSELTQLLLQYGADPQASEPPQRIDLLTKIFDIDGLIGEIYHAFGIRIEPKFFDEKPINFWTELLERVGTSLTQQRERALDLLDANIGAILHDSCPPDASPEDWHWNEIEKGVLECFNLSIDLSELSHVHYVDQLAHEIFIRVKEQYEAKEKEVGTAILLRIFRTIYLEEMDRAWVEHLTEMEHLRDGIGLRGYSQRDPKQEYKMEGYDIFINMLANVSEAVSEKLFRVDVQQGHAEDAVNQLELERLEEWKRALNHVISRHGDDVSDHEEETNLFEEGLLTDEQLAAALERAQRLQEERDLQASRSQASLPPAAPTVTDDEVCPCGSGELFRNCHGAFLEN